MTLADRFPDTADPDAVFDAFSGWAAELACEQAWAGLDRVLGPRHPETLRSRAGLAQVYSRLGRYGDARVLLRDTVDRLERTLPDGDPLITELRQNLADIGEE